MGERMKTKNTKSFASRWGFILASVGSAVGMANVWGFPNKMVLINSSKTLDSTIVSSLIKR